MVNRKYHLLVSLAGAIVSIDQLVKFSVASRLEEGNSLNLGLPFLDITLVKNRGAIFGLLGDLDPSLRDPIFLFLPLLTLLLIIAFYFKLSDRLPYSILSLCLIVGGAIGNLLDRLRLGYVIDYLDFHWNSQYHFPAFNVADMSITAGVVLLAWAMFLRNEDLSSDELLED